MVAGVTTIVKSVNRPRPDVGLIHGVRTVEAGRLLNEGIAERVGVMSAGRSRLKSHVAGARNHDFQVATQDGGQRRGLVWSQAIVDRSPLVKWTHGRVLPVSRSEIGW